MIGALASSSEHASGTSMGSFPRPSFAVVFDACGGIGTALAEALRSSGRFEDVVGFTLSTSPTIDLLDEQSLECAASPASTEGELWLVIDATGFLHDEQQVPETSWRQLHAARIARALALNAIGTALIMKDVLPLLLGAGKSVFATLSARFGRIGDNRLGGWRAYRASKAALNHLVRTAAVELARRALEALCIALHPGTLAAPLSAPFAAAGLEVHTPAQAARHRLAAW